MIIVGFAKVGDVKGGKFMRFIHLLEDIHKKIEIVYLNSAMVIFFTPLDYALFTKVGTFYPAQLTLHY